MCDDSRITRLGSVSQAYFVSAGQRKVASSKGPCVDVYYTRTTDEMEYRATANVIEMRTW